MNRGFTLLTALLLVAPIWLLVDDGVQPVAAAPLGTSSGRQSRAVATPIRRSGIAQDPPRGAKPTQAIRFNPSLQWKKNPSTHTVFAIDADRRVWFIDPTSGWPYTLDQRGIAYTANARTGIVYNLGNLTRWPGSIPYLFGNWALIGGFYSLAGFDAYLSIYTNPAIAMVAYSDTYAEIWQYQNYFESSGFNAQSLSLEASDTARDSQAISDPTHSITDTQTTGDSHGSQDLGHGLDLGGSSNHGAGDFGPGSDLGGSTDFGGSADFSGGGDFGGVD